MYDAFSALCTTYSLPDIWLDHLQPSIRIEFMKNFSDREWFHFLTDDQQKLVDLTIYLYEREGISTQPLSDYSFVIFPMAKAYEGFLKQYLYDSNLITAETFRSHRFRIGRAINPDVHMTQRDDDWLYDDLERMCSKELAQLLWQTWLTCRNRVFHFFPTEQTFLSLEMAGEDITLITQAIEQAHQCLLAEKK